MNVVEPEPFVKPEADALALTVYVPDRALPGIVQVNFTTPFEPVVLLCGNPETGLPEGLVSVTATVAPLTASPEEVTVTVIVTVEPFV